MALGKTGGQGSPQNNGHFFNYDVVMFDTWHMLLGWNRGCIWIRVFYPYTIQRRKKLWLLLTDLMYTSKQSEKNMGPNKTQKKNLTIWECDVICLQDLHVILPDIFFKNSAEVPRFSRVAGGGHDVHHPFCGGCARSHLFLCCREAMFFILWLEERSGRQYLWGSIRRPWFIQQFLVVTVGCSLYPGNPLWKFSWGPAWRSYQTTKPKTIPWDAPPLPVTVANADL